MSKKKVLKLLWCRFLATKTTFFYVACTAI